MSRQTDDLMKEMQLKVPGDLGLLIDDLKVCGRSDLSKLLTLRHKYLAQLQRQNKPETKEAEPMLDSEEEIEKELDTAIKQMEREKKRAAKKEREIKAKSELRQKMSVIATANNIDNDEELHLNPRIWEEIHEKGFEHF